MLGLGGAIAVAMRSRTVRRSRSFVGQSIVITGGSRGLGLEMARRWASEGARITICGRSEESLRRAVERLKRFGGDAMGVVCDVRRREQVETFVETVVREFGGIDVLVNNAGVIQAGPIECMTLDDFETAMATHFWGPLYMIRAALPYLTASRRAGIVNIASIGGEISVPHLVPYSASKFALVALSDGLAAELRQFGIRVTTVCPGLMRTGSHRNALFKGRHRAEFAWFSISDSLPVISMNSTRAAHQIIEACRNGRPHVRLTLPAKLAVPLVAAAPSLAITVFRMVNRLLPSPIRPSPLAHTGAQSASLLSPSILTTLSDSAAVRNNE
jgi:NAD(P)-dependent dehydrogenase (short-subunit alcohol dehydrogenase family)